MVQTEWFIKTLMIQLKALLPPRTLLPPLKPASNSVLPDPWPLTSPTCRHHAAVCHFRGDPVRLELDGRWEHWSRLQPWQRGSTQRGQPGEYHQQRYSSLVWTSSWWNLPYGLGLDRSLSLFWIHKQIVDCGLSEDARAHFCVTALAGAYSETSGWQNLTKRLRSTKIHPSVLHRERHGFTQNLQDELLPLSKWTSLKVTLSRFWLNTWMNQAIRARGKRLISWFAASASGAKMSD